MSVRCASRGSEAVTDGVRVAVSPRFMPDQSDVPSRHFMFAYRIRVENESGRDARLLSRRWLIVDANGREEVVEGDGVVGQQPLIAPGGSFEYASFCPLRTRWGTMQGAYVMERSDGERFEVRIERFYLACE